MASRKKLEDSDVNSLNELMDVSDNDDESLPAPENSYQDVEIKEETHESGCIF